MLEEPTTDELMVVNDSTTPLHVHTKLTSGVPEMGNCNDAIMVDVASSPCINSIHAPNVDSLIGDQTDINFSDHNRDPTHVPEPTTILKI